MNNESTVIKEQSQPTVINTETGTADYSIAPMGNQPNETSTNVIDYTKAVARLSDSQKDELRAMTKSLDPNNLPSIYNWKEASELNHIVGSNAEAVLKTMGNNRAAGDIVAILDTLMVELRKIKFEENSPAKFKQWVSNLPIIGKFVDATETLILKYEKDQAEKVDMITKNFETSITVAQANNTTIQGMIENSSNYIQRIDQLLMAATLKMQDVDAEIAKVQADPEGDMNYLRSLYDFKHLLDKKITSLQGNRAVMMTGVVQLRVQQKNNLDIMQTADDIVQNNVPTLKHNLAAAALLEQQAQQTEAISKFKEGYNQIIVKTSEKLKQVSIQVAKNSENDTLDIESFNKVTNNIIAMIQDVNAIQAKGDEERAKFREQILAQTKRIEDVVIGNNNQ